jgi:hypothetical protein
MDEHAEPGFVPPAHAPFVVRIAAGRSGQGGARA